jgi:hypothetical protein
MYSVSFRSIEEDRRIRAEIERMRRQEQERIQRKQKILSKLEWTQPSSEEIEVPNDFFEIKIQDQWKSDTEIPNKSLFISMANDGLNLAVLDFDLPEEKCEEIVSKFAQEIYQKAAGEEISTENISIQPIARLKHPVCQHCLEIILDFPYQCPACEKGYCYSHRRPESHGCSQKKNTNRTSHNKKPVTRKSKPNRTNRNSKQTKIIIRKIPCG